MLYYVVHCISWLSYFFPLIVGSHVSIALILLNYCVLFFILAIPGVKILAVLSLMEIYACLSSGVAHSSVWSSF